jgi:hypothetical protein
MICATRKFSGHHDQAPPYEPTPEEIQRVCAAIQSEWTEAERRRRTVARTHRRPSHNFTVERRLVVTETWDAVAVEMLDVA